MPTDTETFRYARLHINYFDVQVPTVIVGAAIYFPVRSLCKVLGVGSHTQIKRIKSDSRLVDGMKTLPVPTDTRGIHDTECIQKWAVPIWLATIDPARCSLTARGTLTQFQTELFTAADRFLFGKKDDPFTAIGPVLIGKIKAGPCPNCGARLDLEITDSGSHLIFADDA